MDVATYTVRQQLQQTRVAELRFSPLGTVLATWGPYFGKSPSFPFNRGSVVASGDKQIPASISQFPPFSFWTLEQYCFDFLLDHYIQL